MCQNHKEFEQNPSHFEESEEVVAQTDLSWESNRSLIEGMRFFDPHIHMVSRTTDDYEAMRDAGIVALIEPAFWVGQPRTGLSTFKDYFSSLVGWERFRSSQFGIKHYCTIGLNSREANNEPLAEQVMEIGARISGTHRTPAGRIDGLFIPRIPSLLDHDTSEGGE